MDNQEFAENLSSLCYAPAIILIEDIDCVYSGRENISKTEHSTGITFDFFINKLSGVNELKNKLVFITTNHIEKIDPALLRRFDKKFELLSMSLEEKEQYLKKLTNKEETIRELLDSGAKDSNSVFEQRVLDRILSDYWQEK